MEKNCFDTVDMDIGPIEASSPQKNPKNIFFRNFFGELLLVLRPCPGHENNLFYLKEQLASNFGNEFCV